jgi:TfoX/Sxy family transcriptional regulator of competence genes
MATKQSTIDFILDQLASAHNVRARKMFGEYALYCDEKVVGLVCDDTLFIKITEPGKTFIGRYYKEGHAYPGAKISMMIDGDLIEEREWLRELVRITADNLPLPKRKVKKREYEIYRPPSRNKCGKKQAG